MMIGLRILLLLAIMSAGICFLAFIFTRDSSYARYARNIIKVTLAVGVLVAIIFIAERVLLV